jgi:hypothetical protein
MLKGLGVATETDSVVALERSRLTLNNSIRSSPIWPSSSAQGTVTELYRRVPERPRHSDIRNDVRIFALDRIKMLHQTKETFEIPEDFSLEKFTGSSFGVYQGETAYIKVWFHPDIADYIKEKIVYLHCWGGVGRTGLIVGCWLARHGYKGQAALDRLRGLWQNCPKSTHRKSPETGEQEQYIISWEESA